MTAGISPRGVWRSEAGTSSGSDARSPSREDVLQVRARRAWHEHEEPVTRLDPRAAARRQRAAPAVDGGDERIAWKPELADGGTRHRVVGRDGELDQVELTRRRKLERGLRCR